MKNTDKQQHKRIMFAGGGSGGHVFPIVNLYRFLQDQARPCSAYRAGQRQALEHQQAQQHSIHFLPIITGKYRRTKDLVSRMHNFRDLVKIARGTCQSIYYLLRHRIDVIFLKGGFAAFPLVLAAICTRTPVVIHESDSALGITNRIALRWCRIRTLFTVFPGLDDRAVQVGQVLSDAFGREYSEADLAVLLQRDAGPSPSSYPEGQTGKPLVILIGGSQGARTMYQAFITAYHQQPALFAQFRFVIILGILNQDLQTALTQFDNVQTIDFVSLEELACLYYHADVALTRAGTNSLAEQKIYNVLSLIVPLPWTHDQHCNAQWHVDNHNDILLVQDDDLPQQMITTFQALTNYQKKHRGQTQKIQELHSTKDIIMHALLDTH